MRVRSPILFCAALTACANPPPDGTREAPAPASGQASGNAFGSASGDASQSATPEMPVPILSAQMHATLSVDGNVYDVGAFPQMAVVLAPDPRRETVVALCTPCHSARYITAQPPLAKEIWQAEVTKMVEGFGATIPDDKRADIVDYLAMHYGPDRREAQVGGPVTPQTGASGTPDLATYKTYCIACHGPAGKGVPSAFPPLAQHAASLGKSAAGRTYMIHVVLHGLAGPLQVGGAPFDSMMPPLGSRLTDAEVAAVINEVRQAWPDDGATFEPVSPNAVKACRASEKSPAEVRAMRPVE